MKQTAQICQNIFYVDKDPLFQQKNAVPFRSFNAKKN